MCGIALISVVLDDPVEEKVRYHGSPLRLLQIHRGLSSHDTASWFNSLLSVCYYYRTPVEANVGGEVAREDQNPLDLPAMNPNEPADLPEEEDEEDIPVNGPGGLMMAGGGAGPGIRRRDLVDYLYMLSMIGFLVLMALLTGSLGRLLIFAAGIIFMVL